MAETSHEESASLDGVDCPALYLCKVCRMPLAESEDLSSRLEGDKAVLLKAVTEHVWIDENKAVSTYEVDLFSTVQVLYCKGCSAVVGTLYVATPVLLDFKRDLFQLNTSAVTCYCLNNPQKQRMVRVSEELTTVPYMETQLKKCRTVYGFCEQAVTEIEKILTSRRL
ncbi:protein Mis18-alpha-like [Bufo bufo]|uniref:protein Mis18-alpha-like n=1 Tax=Bufo bufo TaxID=8384 RepID=UPI001ABE1A23|nr:protein Mis18-alpha-like [Bufo bufo]